MYGLQQDSPSVSVFRATEWNEWSRKGRKRIDIHTCVWWLSLHVPHSVPACMCMWLYQNTINWILNFCIFFLHRRFHFDCLRYPPVCSCVCVRTRYQIYGLRESFDPHFPGMVSLDFSPKPCASFAIGFVLRIRCRCCCCFLLCSLQSNHFAYIMHVFITKMCFIYFYFPFFFRFRKSFAEKAEYIRIIHWEWENGESREYSTLSLWNKCIFDRFFFAFPMCAIRMPNLVFHTIGNGAQATVLYIYPSYWNILFKFRT